VLTGFGINCDLETAWALSRVGADAERVHLNDVIEHPQMLDEYEIFVVPGGFSFGDDVASGRILGNRLRYKLGGRLRSFVGDGKLIIGICNGFQVLVKAGILPGFDGTLAQEVTVTWNDTGRFDDRWVVLSVPEDTCCVWLRGIDRLELPIRHGEGRFVPRDEAVLGRIQSGGQVAVRYACQDGSPANGRFPMNPNGSINDIAGICDPSGRVLGLMPHPEAFVHRTNHPRWTREPLREEGAGLQVFRNAVQYAAECFVTR
jgi:phosphoribosylformylglycinamidine synthase